MSGNDSRYEAARWFKTAEQDLSAAKALKDSKHCSHASFLAQQAAEKAVKSPWFAKDADPWGHSVQKLISELPKCTRIAEDHTLLRKAARLDRLYVPTRYPNGIPDLTPGETYAIEDAEEAIQDASCIVEVVRKYLDTF